MTWQRAASTVMARGEVETGLRAYARLERIELVCGAASAQEQAIALWTAAPAGSVPPAQKAIVTRRTLH